MLTDTMEAKKTNDPITTVMATANRNGNTAKTTSLGISEFLLWDV